MARTAVTSKAFKQTDGFFNFNKAFCIFKAVIFDDSLDFLQSLLNIIL